MASNSSSASALPPRVPRALRRALPFCLVLAATVPTANAGIALVSQNRFVDIVSDDGRHQNQSAADFALFSANITLNGIEAFQQSTLTVTHDGRGAEFSALLSTSAGLGIFQSSFLVDFNLTAGPIPYIVSYSSLTASEAGPMPGSPGSFTGPSGPGTLTTGDLLTGTLSPSQYTLQAKNDFSGTIMLDLKLGASAVPLPPAFWAALTTLPALWLSLRRLAPNPRP